MNYVALIRGIMPGNPQMSNASLCCVIESLGYKNVQAVISSGNVLFSSDDTNEQQIEEKISAALRNELDIPGPAIVRSQKELAVLAAAKPFGEQTHTTKNYLMVIFLAEEGERVAVDHPNISVVHTSAREHCIVTNPAVLPGPKAMQSIEKTYGKAITTRTWKTVQRILHKMASMPGDR